MGVRLAWRQVSDEDRRRLETALGPRRRGAEDPVYVFVLGHTEATETPGDDRSTEGSDWETAYAAARDDGAPVLGALTGEATAPAAENLPDGLKGLAGAPWLEADDDLDELLAVLSALEPDETRTEPPARRGAALTGPSSPPRSVRSPRARPSGWRRRDPVLMRISTTSGAMGLLLLGTLGFGPASLFLFLSAVSFSISRLPEGEES